MTGAARGRGTMDRAPVNHAPVERAPAGDGLQVGDFRHLFVFIALNQDTDDFHQ